MGVVEAISLKMFRVFLLAMINLFFVFGPTLCKPSLSANLLDQYNTGGYSNYEEVAREVENLLNSYNTQSEEPHNNPMILRIFKRASNDDWSLNRLTRVKTIDDIKKLRNYMRNL